MNKRIQKVMAAALECPEDHVHIYTNQKQDTKANNYYFFIQSMIVKKEENIDTCNGHDCFGKYINDNT